MIETNRLDYKKDLEEVAVMFDGGDAVKVAHTQQTIGNTFIDEYLVDGTLYRFKNERVTSGLLELKRFEKRFSKLGLYSIFKQRFNAQFEWGALTGIRPVKMAYSALDFEKEFKEVFDVMPKKIELVKDIIETQRGLIDKNSEYDGLFVGIPFCPSRCTYCSFISSEIAKEKNIDEYINCLVKEINEGLKLLKNPRSIYVGGGTPVALKNEHLIAVLTALKPLLNSIKEFTVEAGRPDAINSENLKILKDFGVTRICVNPQTFSNKTLELIGRKHTAESVIEKYYLAKSYGFDINMDIIAGLTNESFLDFKNTVDTVIKLSPDNFTVHTLCLKNGSKLKEQESRLREGEITKMIDYARLKASENGYNPYYLYRQKYSASNLENVGYSKKGKECIYNIDVMEETSNNVACGANAVSKLVIPSENRIERYGNPKNIATYIQKIDEIIKSKRELYN
ncbi:MAG: coproporphyrinogen dehydrogenase HemZ [Clostridia bacterium]|nr:coproporphyrinogen dehydrogenase HemZ [Clostridia bacterium]